MTDLTKITAPFGLLDKATQNELQAASKAGAKIVMYVLGGWKGVNDPNFFSTSVYRVKPVPVRASHYSPKYLDGRCLGRHYITYNEDYSEPTITWEPTYA